MILLDMSAILYSSLFISTKMVKNKSIASEWGNHSNGYSEEMLRHLILNTIRTYRSEFYRKYGEIVICCDSGDVWRKDFFPYYKQGRSEGRKISDIPWNEVFSSFTKILNEIDESFPYKVISINRMEGDDIIATLCLNKHPEEKMLIVSSDKDLLQLTKDNSVELYSHSKKHFVSHDNPILFLAEQILSGDKSDGIPNVLSDSDTFIMQGKRQNTLSAKKKKELLETNPLNYETKVRDNYLRNKKLIDLEEIPKELQEQALAKYNMIKERNNQKIMKYFVEHKLKNLVSYRGDF